MESGLTGLNRHDTLTGPIKVCLQTSCIQAMLELLQVGHLLIEVWKREDSVGRGYTAEFE